MNCLFTEVKQQCATLVVSTGICDHFSALLVSLMALRLALVGQNPFWQCLFSIFKSSRKMFAKKKLDIASQRSVSLDGTWLKRDIQSIMFSCFQCIKCENISKNGISEVLWQSVDDLQ